MPCGKSSANSSMRAFTPFATSSELDPGSWYTAIPAVGFPSKRDTTLYFWLPNSMRATSFKRRIRPPSSTRRMISPNSSGVANRPFTFKVYWKALLPERPKGWPTFPADTSMFCAWIAAYTCWALRLRIRIASGSSHIRIE